MPIYLVRWPTFSVSLIQAEDEDELIERLDEIGDPGGCSWRVYNGPLWVDFELPAEVEISEGVAEPSKVGDLHFDGLEDLAEEPHLELRPAIPLWSETASEMLDEVRARGFPHLHRLAQRAGQRDFPDEPLSLRSLRSALRKESAGYLAWRERVTALEQRHDAEALVLRQLGLTVATPAMKEALMKIATLTPEEVIERMNALGKKPGSGGPAGGESALNIRLADVLEDLDDPLPF